MSKSIVVEYGLPHTPEQVWRVLTEAKLLAKWLMPNDIAPKVGHRFTFTTKPIGDWDGVVHCEVLLVEPLKRLRYRWCGDAETLNGRGGGLNTVVTWTLSPGGAGTKLLLEHEGFRDQDSFAYEAMGGGWRGRVAARMSEALTQS